ncbi:hypothetical protein ACFWBF_28670 [Streptomyces sp. NPDC060028]|uniref:hypothetical protein n=1 Tax=Streptomyces sp. NPDC060028 TaxID=3347041 RepID=UPI0036A2AE21
MTSHDCARGVVGIDTPDGYPAAWGTRVLGEPSAELLGRARVGWEHFTGSREEPTDA